MSGAMPFELERAGMMQDLAALFLYSKTASDFCRGIVMDPVMGSHAIGSELLLLTQSATLKTLAFFGTPMSSKGEIISLWDQSLIAEASRSNNVTKGQFKDPETDDDVFVYCYPLSSLTQTLGVVVLLKSQESEVQLKEEDRVTLALVGALWLQSIGASTIEDRQGEGMVSPVDLTDRQLAILRQMSEGKTNAQIAVDLIVSQSTIRKETIKIYASLSVSGRSEATKRAFHLGLVDSPAA
jgi:DNA-binding CsgD family transcriptional regulator